MKYLSLYLNGYGGIYNGMGLSEIFIDFRLCKHKTIIIRGENGSGKSTIFNALSVLPDHNDKFIPGVPASKEVYIQDGLNVYCISFKHPVGANGKRGTTEAFIKKSTNGSPFVELNHSGNVTSYKDILYEELSLDANFIALSQLSMDDKGLANKKPAERKRFVNSIISSLDTYNGIYKSLNKRSSIYKSMIESITTKLGQIGDENLLNSNLHDIDSRVSQIKSERDQLLELIGKYKSDVLALDADGSIQSDYKEAKEKKRDHERYLDRTENSIKTLLNKGIISFHADPKAMIKDLEDQIKSLEIENQLLKSKKSSLLADSEAEYNVIAKKQTRLAQLGEEDKYQEIYDRIVSYEAECESILNRFSGINIDISSFTKDEFILALNILKFASDEVKTFKSNFSYEVLEKSIEVYSTNGNIKLLVERSVADLDQLNARYDSLKAQIERLEYLLEKINILSNRPIDCKIDTCSFLTQLCGDAIGVDRSKTEEDLSYLKFQKEECIKDIEASTEYNTFINEVFSAYRDLLKVIDAVTPTADILKKLPNGHIYSNPLGFVQNLLTSNFLSEQIQNIYSYIEIADMIYVYNTNISVLEKLRAELEVHLNRKDIIDSLITEIDELNRKLNGIKDEIDSTNSKIRSNDFTIIDLTSKISEYRSLLDLQLERKMWQSAIIDFENTMESLSSKMEAINIGLTNIDIQTKQLEQMDRDLMNLHREREKISHSIEMTKEYKEEYAKLSRQYEIIDTIKYYSSPTTGIQLVFMELYMGNIINLANELLRLLFNGAFEIQPFIINESEFRIPCLGDDRIMNDDISSMSSAQLSMVSMVLSFSLLYHSSTKYNIIKLDEIDAPLDENKRIMFLTVLDKIMNIMNTDQCILISHNSELQVDYSDVILLKVSEGFNTEYNRGNIIWRYN